MDEDVLTAHAHEYGSAALPGDHPGDVSVDDVRHAHAYVHESAFHGYDYVHDVLLNEAKFPIPSSSLLEKAG